MRAGVKRRSVRGTSSRQSRRSDRSGRGDGAGSSGTHRSSTRSSRRKVHQNPVTKLMEQQQNSFPTSFKHKHSGSNLTENNLKTLNNDYILNNQYHHQIPKKEMMPSKSTPALNSFHNQKQKNELTSAAMHRHTPTDPIYYNMNSSSPLLIQQAAWNETSTPSPQAYATNHFHHHHPNDAAASLGHTNLTYVHSNPSLADGEMNEYYQPNRPPSVRSSYSNFHGARPLSYNQNPAGTSGNSRDRDNVKENLFANLSQQQQQQQHHHQHSNRPQVLYQSSQPQAVPQAQVPMKRNAAGSRESLRFLNAAPPAYHQYNHHTPPDSETTM
jgi:hypothetical protein